MGYELFEGNTADVKTLEPAIASLKARFALDRLVFVADAEMLSADNVALLHSLGHDYVVAAKDAHEREQAVKKARKRLASGIKGSGRKGRYLKVNRDAVKLNEAAIERGR